MIGLDRADGVWTVTLDRPEKANALTEDMLRRLAEIAEEAQEARAFVLTGTGPVFSAGADLEAARAGLARSPLWERLSGAIAALPCVSIAALNGTAAGGCMGMVLACDLVVAAETAKFGHPAGRDLGIPPTVFLWPMLIGMKKTREFLYTARLFSAAEAERLGLVNQVVPLSTLDATVDALAADIARTPVNNLAILKQATSRFYENMGLFASGDQAAELDAVFHQSETFVSFFARAAEDGVQAALAARRKRFG